MSSTALSGSEAISPHTLTGMFAARPISSTCRSCRTIDGMMRREAVREPGVAAVHRHRVLGEVIGAHAEELAHLGEPVADEHGRRRLDHDADGHRRGGPDSLPAQRRGLLQHHLPRLLHLFHQGHQRQHELDVPVHRGPENGADLWPEDLGLVEADANGAPAEEGVGLLSPP